MNLSHIIHQDALPGAEMGSGHFRRFTMGESLVCFSTIYDLVWFDLKAEMKLIK